MVWWESRALSRRVEGCVLLECRDGGRKFEKWKGRRRLWWVMERRALYTRQELWLCLRNWGALGKMWSDWNWVPERTVWRQSGEDRLEHGSQGTNHKAFRASRYCHPKKQARQAHADWRVQAEAEAELATPARLQKMLPCGRVGSEIQMFLISKLKIYISWFLKSGIPFDSLLYKH